MRFSKISPLKFPKLAACIIITVLLRPILATGRGDAMKHLVSFLVSVAAGITAYYVCKWLDAFLSLLE